MAGPLKFKGLFHSHDSVLELGLNLGLGWVIVRVRHLVGMVGVRAYAVDYAYKKVLKK